MLYEGKKLSYRHLLNPTISIELGNLGTSKENYSKAPVYSVVYSQPITYPSLFKFAEGAYEFQKQALNHRIEIEKNKLAQEVYLLFYQALYLQELLKVLEQELSLQRDIKDFVEKSFKLGEITKLELFRAQREVELLEIEKRLIEARYMSLLEKLSVITGSQVNSLEASFDIPPWKDLNLEESPLLAYYKSNRESLSKQLEIEKALGRPTYTVSLTAEKVAEKEYGFRIGLTVGIPAFYARQGEILELISYRELSLAEEKAQRLKAISQLSSAKRQYMEIIKEIERIEKELIPQAQKELELAIKSYKLRTITLLELSQTRKSYYELLKKKIELIFEAHKEYSEGILYGGSQWCGCY